MACINYIFHRYLVTKITRLFYPSNILLLSGGIYIDLYVLPSKWRTTFHKRINYHIRFPNSLLNYDYTYSPSFSGITICISATTVSHVWYIGLWKFPVYTHLKNNTWQSQEIRSTLYDFAVSQSMRLLGYIQCHVVPVLQSLATESYEWLLVDDWSKILL